MFTLVISDNNSVVASQRDTIMQRSNIVDNIQILVPRYYRGQIDLSTFRLYMKYTLPISRKIKMAELQINDLDYNRKNHIQYVLPANIPITAEPGDIEVSFTFLSLVADEDGSYKSYIRKTEPGVIPITPVAVFEQYEPDELFGEIDQRLLALEAVSKDLDQLSQNIYDNMVTDVRLDTDNKKITLTNRDGDTGKGLLVNDLSTMIGEELIGTDPDGITDGVTKLDDILNNVQPMPLDSLLKK